MSARRRSVEVETRRGVVTADYRPGDLTLADYDDAETNPYGAACRVLVSCVARWNLATQEGKPFPITAASVRRLDEKLVFELANAIALDLRAMLAAEQRAKGGELT